jgi:hypothetical protein
MDMRMERKILAPSMENNCGSGLCTKEFRIPCKFRNRVAGTFQKERIKEPLILINKRIKLVRQSKHHMKIRNRQKLRQLSLNPLDLLRTLTLRTMPVPARIKRNLKMTTAIASINMRAKHTRPAVPNGGEGLRLIKRKPGKRNSIKNILDFRHKEHLNPKGS